MTTVLSRLGPLLVPLLLTACGGEQLRGNYFNVRLEGDENLCTDGGTDYAETLRYRVEFDVTDLDVDGVGIIVAVDADEFAIGTVNSCFIEYSTIVNTSLWNGQELRWRIDGNAKIDRAGGNTCLNEQGEEKFDWIGTETFTVVRSTPESGIDPGCTYTLETTGVFAGFATEPEEDGATFGGVLDE